MKLSYEERLLNDWEEVFRQGMLTFWVFVALDNRQLSVKDLAVDIKKLTNETYNPVDQTLYRLLRKHYDLELVDYVEVPGKGGPNKKLYSLSGLGKKLLTSFAQRNISLFLNQRIVKLVKEKT